MLLKPQDSVALQFKNGDDFQEAMETFLKLRKDELEAIPFALTPRKYTVIIPKKYLPHFERWKPEQQAVGSVSDLPFEKAEKLREKYFWPKRVED